MANWTKSKVRQEKEKFKLRNNLKERKIEKFSRKIEKDGKQLLLEWETRII